MSPETALARLRGFCDDRERRHREQRLPNTVPVTLEIATIRGVLDYVDPEPVEPVLRITEKEAAWILGRWTREDAELAAEALTVHAHAEQKAGNESTATAAIELASKITEASR